MADELRRLAMKSDCKEFAFATAAPETVRSEIGVAE
jgi:hypothetical protein